MKETIDVKVMSRELARTYSSIKEIPSSVIISINDFDQYQNKFYENPHIKSILYETFNDIESGEYSITKKQAKQIVNFVKVWINKVDVIVVHCGAGISRSAGVGAAILKWAIDDDTQIFNNGRYCPNMRCYRYILNAFMMDIDEKELYTKFQNNIMLWNNNLNF